MQIIEVVKNVSVKRIVKALMETSDMIPLVNTLLDYWHL